MSRREGAYADACRRFLEDWQKTNFARNPSDPFGVTCDYKSCEFLEEREQVSQVIFLARLGNLFAFVGKFTGFAIASLAKEKEDPKEDLQTEVARRKLQLREAGKEMKKYATRSARLKALGNAHQETEQAQERAEQAVQRRQQERQRREKFQEQLRKVRQDRHSDEQMRGIMRCKVCLDAVIQVIVLRCKHLCLCSACLETLQKKAEEKGELLRCPLCKE
eukprot:Skav209419  [mRNA]  locus=scaffold1411:335714:336373:+ [translate_table: standard]